MRKKLTSYRLGVLGLSAVFLISGGALTQTFPPKMQAYAVSADSVSDADPYPYQEDGAETIHKEEPAEEEADRIAKELIAAGVERDFLTKPAVKTERSEMIVVLDPGHGGEDEGCSREGVSEKEINLQIAKAAREKLLEMGYQVVLTRDGDETLTIQERADLANGLEADLYVSIHQNACEERFSDAAGIETWYNEGKAGSGSLRLAKLLHRQLLSATQARDREVIADESLYVIRETDMPACLVETGFLSNREEREKLTTKNYQDQLAQAVASGIDLYFFPKTMYLTFDDGPSAENTDIVLDILKECDIHATFFLIGENVEKHPEVARRIAEEGHTIGIHCYNHDYKTLYASVDSYVADFEKAREIVYETTGVETNLFRFPGGSINQFNKAVYRGIIEEMTDRGYTYFDWNASLEDATKRNEPARLLENAKTSTLGRKKVVMLAHDRVANTALCLKELIGQFPEYRMLPLTEDVEPIRF